MPNVHNDEPLDWATYKALSQVILDLRNECVKKREDPSTEDWEKDHLLYKQVTLTEARGAMLEFMVDNLDRSYGKKDS